MSPKENYDKLLIKREKQELQLQELNTKVKLKELELKATCLGIKQIRSRKSVGVMNG